MTKFKIILLFCISLCLLRQSYTTIPSLDFWPLVQTIGQKYADIEDKKQAVSEEQSDSKKLLLTLYYSPYCPYSQEVLSYLKKINKSIPLKDVKKDPQAKEELKKLGGILEVPCLIINDQALYKSEAIIEWLHTHQYELDTTSKP